MRTAKLGKAAILVDAGQAFQIREFEVPHPEPGAIVVRVLASTVCGSDVHIWEGSDPILGSPFRHPVILGHEIVGEIVSMGAGAEVDSIGQPLNLGDRLIWAPTNCGNCTECITGAPMFCSSRRQGMYSDCSEPPHFGGGFAEYSYLYPGSGRLKVAPRMPTEWASAASCALRSVISGTEGLGALDYRNSVVIQGAGPLGLFATALMSLHAPRQLIVIGGPDERLALAKEWGATDTVSVDRFTSAQDRINVIRELTGGGGDVIIEVSGARTAFSESLHMAGNRGRIAVIGQIGGNAEPITASTITRRSLKIQGSFSAGIDSYWAALQFLDKHRDTFDWDRMISNRYDLNSLDVCMERMQRHQEIKPVVVP